MTVFGILLTLTTLYIFFPDFLRKAFIKKHVHVLLWHFSNLILGFSWAMFFYFFWALFW
jgi:cellobiose-specific phosphotransferase system component IIC